MASTFEERKSISKPILESLVDLLREGVFKAMFTERLIHDREIPLEDVDPKIFQKFLEFIYSDTFVADVSEGSELLKLAHEYDVQLLFSKCETLLENEVNLGNALDVFQAARKCHKFQLMEKVGDLWATSMPHLQTLHYFSRVDKETLMYILKRNDLNMKEVDIFCLAVEWTKTQSGLPVLEIAADILPLIRFPTMTLEEFTGTVIPTGLLPQSTLNELFTYFRSDAKSKNSLACNLKFSTQLRVAKSPIVHVNQFIHKPFNKAVSPSLPVKLYPEFDHWNNVGEEYTQLRECLEFDIMHEVLEASVASEPEEGNIALSSISLYCPKLTSADKHSEGYTSFLRSKQFRIIVKTKQCGGNYVQVFTMSLFLKEETIKKVELNPMVHMENGRKYCIIIEETGNALWEPEGNRAKAMYKARCFGRLQPLIMVKEKRVCFQNVRRNELSEFQDCSENGDPHMIYKLGLKE